MNAIHNIMEMVTSLATADTHKPSLLPVMQGKHQLILYYYVNTHGFPGVLDYNTHFLSLDSSDVQCGQLQCIPGSFRNTFGVSVSILTVSVFSSGRIEDCQ